MTRNHESFWDCIEQATTVRKAHRRVGERGDVDSFLVSVYGCEVCDEMHVLEVFDQGGEFVIDENRYGLVEDATVEDVLEDYGIDA